jgi:hypothetical protein
MMTDEDELLDDMETIETFRGAPDETTTTTTTTTTTAATSHVSSSSPPPSSSMMFPCMEQPLRITLSCQGYYLWGIRGNRVIARQRRSEKDEFRLHYTDRQLGIVEIINHKFGGLLSVVTDDDKDKNVGGSSSKVVWIKNETITTENEGREEEEVTATANNELGLYDSQENNNGDDDDSIDEPAVNSTSATTEEGQKWWLIRGAQNNQVMIKSLKTGENLSIDNTTHKVVLVADTNDRIIDPHNNTNTTATTTTTSVPTITWNIDCVTGELCFLSNAHPSLNRRQLRCDLAGMLTLTDAWKGWEVFRFMEATHGYVKLSSWMHSQWLLCSTADGTVSTCSHAESLLDDKNPKGCCQWAIEMYIPASYHPDKDDENRMVCIKGVILRSKTHGRLLSVSNGTLRTYSQTDRSVTNGGRDHGNTDAAVTNMSVTGPTTSDTTNTITTTTQWLNNSVQSMNARVKTIQQRWNSTSLDQEKISSSKSAATIVIPPEETIVWQLEAAHLQTYYFGTNVVEDGEKPKTIGPFPLVTPNLRKTDKIQLKRVNDSGRDGDVIRLYETEEKQYIACSWDGVISFVEPTTSRSTVQILSPDTEWIMDKPHDQSGGTSFRSKPHNLYLSYQDVKTSEASNPTHSEKESAPTSPTNSERFQNLFTKPPEPMAQLAGSKVLGPREVWKLEPCMPRAVSSEKIATFAIGTSIAVGTTIALPFALAGAGLMLGAVGAEAGILFNAIAVGLTGAEALASVGAIGATAYIVFRPEDNSLTDDHNKSEEEAQAERAWSKRPFSNWRNW